MDDGELEFSNQEAFSNSNILELPLSNSSMDTFFDELLRDSHACTHTHTCNPPGPENTHTHTCLHVHTKILPAQSDDKVSTDDTSESSGKKKSKKRPLGNREAVRKYREKKKAKAASLEDEVIRLRTINNQLLKRLQGQAALEAEVTRLKCLLVDIRGRIEGEIGSFPYQKPAVTTNVPFSYMMNPCNMQCDVDSLYCLQNGNNGGEGVSMNEQGINSCEFDQLRCLGNQNLAGKEIPVCSNGNGTFNVDTSGGANKREGGTRAAKAV